MFRDQPFIDRRDAGRRLAVALARTLPPGEAVVFALPRGGVPVGYEIARELELALDVLLVRKLGAPGFPELGLGAVVDGEPPQCLLNRRVIDAVQPPPGYVEAEQRRQLETLAQRRQTYRRGRAPEPVEGRIAVLVDDGIATGGTARAALQALAGAGAARTVLAVPVAPPGVLEQLPLDAHDFVCLLQPPDFAAVGAYYRDFSQITDGEVIEMLARARAGFGHRAEAPGAAPGARQNPSTGGPP